MLLPPEFLTVAHLQWMRIAATRLPSLVQDPRLDGEQRRRSAAAMTAAGKPAAIVLT